MKRHNLILVAPVLLSLGSAGAVGYGIARDVAAANETNARITARTREFGLCQERFKVSRSCLSDQERDRLQTEAEKDRKDGKYKEAGLKFAKLGRENEAREMAGRCSEADRKAVQQELNVELKAREMASKLLK